jgi:alpha-L-fucosidase
MQNEGIMPEEYRKLAYPESGDNYFAADKFNADEWAKIAKAAGMKYMSLTTQHHDGYALFDSKYINIFSSKQTHNRDFVKEYVDACRSNGLKVGLYKTLINWRYPGYYDVNGVDCKKRMVRKYQPDAIVDPRTGWYGDYKSEEGSSPITGPIGIGHISNKIAKLAAIFGIPCVKIC